MDDRLSAAGADWLTQLQGLEPGARKAGRKRMEELLAHIRDGLQQVLLHDPRMRMDALTGDLSAEAVCRFTLDGMLEALRRGDHDCATLLALLDRALYR